MGAIVGVRSAAAVALEVVLERGLEIWGPDELDARIAELRGNA